MNKSNTSFLTSLKGLCNRTFLLMLLIEALNNFATTTVKTPINVFGAALGASAVIIGLSSSLYNFTATATRPFSGFAMSRVNHKRWLQICMVLRMASFALFIVTNNRAAFIKLLPNDDGRKPVFVEFCRTGIVITRVNHNRSVDASLGPPVFVCLEFFFH